MIISFDVAKHMVSEFIRRSHGATSSPALVKFHLSIIRHSKAILSAWETFLEDSKKQ